MIPLNQVRVESTVYPASTDVLPMIKKLRYDSSYEKAFDLVFGKTLICRDLETASSYARSQGFNCVTLEGDQVNRKGALTGGYHDVRRSRLETIEALKAARTKVKSFEIEARTVKASIQTVDQLVSQALGELQKAETRRKQQQDAIEHANIEIGARVKEEFNLRTMLDQKERALLNLKETIASLHGNVTALEGELEIPFGATLTPREQESLSEWTREIDQLAAHLAQASVGRAEIETQKAVLENALQANLLRRRDDLSAALVNLDATDATGQLAARHAELREILDSIALAESRRAELDQQLEQTGQRLRELAIVLEELQAVQDANAKALQEQGKSLEKALSKRANLLRKKEECMRKIRELGTLPAEAFEKYASTPASQVCQAIHSTPVHRLLIVL